MLHFCPPAFPKENRVLSNTPRPFVRPCVRACVRRRYARSLKYCMYHHQISQEHCSGPTEASLLIFCWNSNSKMAAGSHLGFSWCRSTGMRAALSIACIITKFHRNIVQDLHRLPYWFFAEIPIPRWPPAAILDFHDVYWRVCAQP